MKIKFKLFASLLIAICISCSQGYGGQQPNIIFIMADDMGYGDLGCYGQKFFSTPNIDALAAGGIRFTNYYSGNTVCAPSREALLTGMHTGHTYIRGNFLTEKREDPALPADKKTIAEYFKAAGYQTALIGKWGLGGEEFGPDQQGFDYTYGYLDQIQAHNYYPPFLYENGKKFNLDKNADGKTADFSHDLFVEKTVNFLNTRGKDKPFFLYLPYTIPHGNYNLPPAPPYDTQKWTKVNQTYATMIAKLDKDIGRIVQLIKEQGMEKNTLIVFTSDNGANPGFARFFKSNGEFRGAKRDMYEGGIRVPFIAYWPGKIKAGQQSSHVAAAWDILPTLCEIAGIKTAVSLDGISFLPALTGKKQRVHDYLYWEYYDYNYNWDKPNNKLPRNWLENAAVRMGNWKAVKKDLLKSPDAAIELYNLETDPGEQHDVAADNPKIMMQIQKIFLTASVPNAPYFPYHQTASR